MAKYELSPAELETHLAEQLGFLQRSAQLFDEGYEVEARRIAVTLRVLLHTGRYPSLLKHLGRDGMDFYDSMPPYNPRTVSATMGLISWDFDESGVGYSPLLDGGLRIFLMPFSDWWERTVFSGQQDWTFSRCELVLAAADQEGAHVDDALSPIYAALRHDNSLGWVDGDGKELKNDPVYAAIRQIAHEVLKTFTPEYSRTGEDVRAVRKKAKVSEGKMHFYPHESGPMLTSQQFSYVEGRRYMVEFTVETITTGNVQAIINSAFSEPVTSIGTHRLEVIAESEPRNGFLGHKTDAVLSHWNVSLVE